MEIDLNVSDHRCPSEFNIDHCSYQRSHHEDPKLGRSIGQSGQTVLHRCYQSATFFVGKFQLAPTKDHDRYTGQDPDQNAKWITFDRHISGDRPKDRWDQSAKDRIPDRSKRSHQTGFQTVDCFS